VVKLQSFFNGFKGAKILDVGTGNGNFLRIVTALYNDYSKITGIDLSEVFLEECRKTFDDERIEFLSMDAYNMEFEDDTYDIVCLSNSLHHLEDLDKALKEMERVLKPGGAIVFCEMVNNNLTKKQRSHLLIHHYAAEVDRTRGVFHDETFSDKQILQILRDKSSLDIKMAWTLNHPSDDSSSNDDITWLFDTIDRVNKRVEGFDNKEYFYKKADKMKKYIKKYGFKSAPQLMTVLR